MNSQKKKVVCFGEVLWDIFPDKTKPGGAPMNVAYHLKKFGINSSMISRVGKDLNGSKLINLLENWGISVQHIQFDDDYSTGKVVAIVGKDDEMSYVIQPSVAWDNIQHDLKSEDLVKNSDAFVFGTLSARNVTSRNTLFQLLKKASYKVFDINLRPPFYNQELVEYLLYECNLLKLNSSELELLSGWFQKDAAAEKNSVQFLQKQFNIAEIIVTKGSKGATYYNHNDAYSFPAVQVKVKDTVGSGDSFLAAFLANKITGESIETSMSYATALGAFVASKEGACPNYTTEQLEQSVQINI